MARKLSLKPPKGVVEFACVDLLTQGSQETTQLPDWGKMKFVQFPGRPWEQTLPGIDTEGMDLVARLIRYQSSDRVSAAEVSLLRVYKGTVKYGLLMHGRGQVLEHPFLQEGRS